MQKKDKTRIMFWGDAVIETGFARVAHSIVKYLPDTYDVSWIGVNYRGDPHKYSDLKIYPASTRGDIYGLNRLQEIVSIEQPQKIFMINDAWVLNPMLGAIKKTYSGDYKPDIYTYVPVDAADHDGDWYTNFDIVKQVVAYTPFGRDEIVKASPALEDKITILPHGVDTSVFFQIPNKSKEEIKRSVYPNPECYDDSFIVFNGNRNQPRKRIDITMLAFKLFAEGKPANVKLYLHMGVVDSHIHIQKMARRLGIENRLIVTSFHGGVQTVPTDRLNVIYNATDVGINTSVGEGWGLVNMEHAVTGVPQVVGNHSALGDLYSDCGLTVSPSMAYTIDNIMTTGYLGRPEDFAEKLNMLYYNKDLRNELSKKSVDKFTSPEYSWKNISRRWVKEIFEK